MNKKISDKTISEWIEKNPILKNIINGDEVFWCNPLYDNFSSAESRLPLSNNDIKDAEERLQRFAPYISKIFPETKKNGGIIESPLLRLSTMQQHFETEFSTKIPGNLLIKCDNQLAISGSIKARGGIYEVLKHAETLAFNHKKLSIEDNYSKLASDSFKQFFSRFSIAVGSTGNLGLSIGIIGAQLGFKVVVHMSSDAKQWKKTLLKEKGVVVIEYTSDYSKAVDEGRKQAALDPAMHFIDDEQSTDLFLGYSTAASRLEKQLSEFDIQVTEKRPLFVYLPCGVGGGPGGITFGLKQLFKDNVHCFFAEPTPSPCMLLGLMTRLHDKINVKDFGLDNITAADGLAVGRPSGFVGKTLERLISGVYTVQDKTLYNLLQKLCDLEAINLEPSAVAGLPGVIKLFNTPEGKSYLKNNSLTQLMPAATHIVWATGGSMVPEKIMQSYYQKGIG